MLATHLPHVYPMGKPNFFPWFSNCRAHRCIPQAVPNGISCVCQFLIGNLNFIENTGANHWSLSSQIVSYRGGTFTTQLRIFEGILFPARPLIRWTWGTPLKEIPLGSPATLNGGINWACPWGKCEVSVWLTLGTMRECLWGKHSQRLPNEQGIGGTRRHIPLIGKSMLMSVSDSSGSH